MPAYDCRLGAISQRVRSVPKAAASRGAQTGPGAGKAREERLVGVVGEEGGDLAVERADRREQRAELRRIGLDRETERVHDRRVGRQRLGGGDLREARVDHRRAAAVVVLIEPPDGGRPSALDGGERGPRREKVTRLAGVEAPHPVEGLGEVLLEQAGEPIGHRPTPVDQLAAVLAEQVQLAGRDGIRLPGPELRPVGADQVEQQGRIGRVVLGPAGREDFPIPG